MTAVTPGHAASERWLSSRDAVARLGVKPATLYAYVSRGLVARHKDDHGVSWFSPADIERLAARGRMRPEDASSHRPVESAITLVRGNTIAYRGHPVTMLARDHSFEDVAELLWTGRLSDTPASWWPGCSRAAQSARPVARSLPANTPALDRLRVVIAALAASAHSDPGQPGLPPTVQAQQLIRDLVEVGTEPYAARHETGAHDSGSIAEQLRRRLVGSTCAPRQVRKLIDTILILRADHELAHSALAARVAAASGASIHFAVLAAASTGPYGVWGSPVMAFDEVLRLVDGPAALRRLIESCQDSSPWFGHPLYPDGDPRAAFMLGALEAAVGDSVAFAKVNDLHMAAARAGLPKPNMHFAIGATAFCLGMPPGAAHILSTTSRTAGWIAHTMEEHSGHSLTRQRAIYIGTPPPCPEPA